VPIAKPLNLLIIAIMEFWLQAPLLFFAGIWVAALNAVAGGGAFFSFPILMFFGLPPIAANATGKFAIWLGASASIKGYWPEIISQKDKLLAVTLLATLGSIIGSLLLLVTPSETFRAMVPWLMLIATLVFAFGKQAVALLAGLLPHTHNHSLIGKVFQWIGMSSIGIYGGFFGAGMGILLVAFCQLVGIHNVHQANAIKVVVATGITTLSTFVFIIAGVIAWPQAIALGLGTLVGGYYGASFARRLPQKIIRALIIAYGLIVSVYFFASPL
jgi:uncharacterized membrane protein YfcA